MKTSTAEFLSFLFWSTDELVYPSLRQGTDVPEGWLFRKGLLQHLRRWEKQGLLESTHEEKEVYRFTEKGRLHVLGGRDPEIEWNRSWDGKWRQVLFDVPADQRSLRDKLRRSLQLRYFGCVQNSVWISPDPLGPDFKLPDGKKFEATSFLIFEGTPASGDESIVQAAWDFGRINDRYTVHLEWLDKAPALEGGCAKALPQWVAKERSLWLRAVGGDPLLPARLLPQNYLGREAWIGRKKILTEASKCIPGRQE